MGRTYRISRKGTTRKGSVSIATPNAIVWLPSEQDIGKAAAQALAQKLKSVLQSVSGRFASLAAYVAEQIEVRADDVVMPEGSAIDRLLEAVDTDDAVKDAMDAVEDALDKRVVFPPRSPSGPLVKKQ
jgi:hypothetical protein